MGIIISSRDAGGAEGVISTETVAITDPAFTIFGIDDIDLSSLVANAPGEYVLRM